MKKNDMKLHFLWRENYIDYLWAKNVTACVYFQHSGVLLYEDSVLTGYATPEEIKVINKYTDHLLENPKAVLQLSKEFDKTREKVKNAASIFSKKSVTASANKELYKLFVELVCLFKSHIDVYRHTEPHYIEHVERLALKAVQKVTDSNPYEFLAKLLSERGVYHKKYNFTEEEHELFDMLDVIAHMRFEAKKIDTPLVIFAEQLLREVARRTELSINQVSNLDLDELEELLVYGKIPNLEKVNKRQYLFVLKVEVIRDKVMIRDVNDKEVEALVAYERSFSNAMVLKGETAYPGKTTGAARIVPLLSSPEEYEEYISTLQKTDVLIAPMTAPSLTPAFSKVAAVVTDEGGLMSHAALVAREKKVPCIIGTKSATRTFQEGEAIIVDAVNGTVTKDQK